MVPIGETRRASLDLARLGSTHGRQRFLVIGVDRTRRMAYRFEGKQKTLALGVYARGITVREIPKLDGTSLKRNARLPAQANSQPEKA
jgi:hypothetical protein